jgi:hypothetical protein
MENIVVNYFLHVDVTLKDRKAESASGFERNVRKFLAAGAFGTGKLDGLLFLKTTRRAKAGSTPDYVHLWSVPSVTSLDLANVMNDSRDNPLYKKIDAYVALETQEFIVHDDQVDTRPGATVGGRLATPARGKSRFVRVVHQCRNSAEYGVYAADIISFVIYVENRGWDCLGVFWSVTGQLNTFTEFWRIPAKADEKLKTMIAAAKEGGAPNEVLKAYQGFPQTSRLLLTEYAKVTPPGGKKRGSVSVGGAK